VLLPLGLCRTRSIAERKCREHVEKLGINSTQRLLESISRITFKQQAELWLRSLANRKRNPLEQRQLKIAGTRSTSGFIRPWGTPISRI
jgi:hypothetical protein